MEKIRLSKLMSERGLCSRREADQYGADFAAANAARFIQCDSE